MDKQFDKYYKMYYYTILAIVLPVFMAIVYYINCNVQCKLTIMFIGTVIWAFLGFIIYYVGMKLSQIKPSANEVLE